MKRAKLLKMLNGLLSGKTWSTTIKGIPIRREPKRFTKRELASLHGGLNHFSLAHTEVFVKLTPLIRVSNSVQRMDDLITISFKTEPWLFKAISEIKDIVSENRWVSFDEIVASNRFYQDFKLCFADAAGVDDFEDSFGVGGLCTSAQFAFQISHSLVNPFLRSLQDRNPFPHIIYNGENLVQVFMLWYGFHIGRFAPGTLIELRTDNTAVYHAWRNGRCRYAAQSYMLDRVSALTESMGCHFEITWVNTDMMKASGADALSRNRFRKINGIPVTQICPSTFGNFKNFFRFPRYD